MTRIKICGLIRERDAQLALKYGADFLGFIFYRRSPRYITPTQCRKIVNNLDPAARTVGVFVDEDVDTIIKIVRAIRLSFVQLHGHETSGDIRHLQRAGIRVIKSVPVTPDGRISGKVPKTADLILYDTIVDGKSGGTGQAFAWTALKKLTGNYIVAGGLNSTNIGDVIRLLRPYAVDVSSGIESAPGIKSQRKLSQLMKVVIQQNATY